MVIGGFVSDVTTIQLEKQVLKELKEVKQYPRQTYSELVLEMTKLFKMLKPQKTSYDEFLRKVQQAKMKELLDNKEDKILQKQATKRGWSEAQELFGSAIASEKSLGKLWNLKEEDERWKNL